MAPRNQFPEAELRVRKFWLLLGWGLILFVIYRALVLELESAYGSFQVLTGEELYG